MKPKRIIIVRHGESQSNADKATRGVIQDHRIDLTDKGKAQALSLGYRLLQLMAGESFGMWVSPFNRTRRTAEFMLKNMTQPLWVREDPRIREQEWGHLRSVEEAQRVNDERDSYSRFWYRIPDGESGADVFDRVSTFFETMHRDFKKPDHPQNLILVSHGYTSRIMLMRWLHQTVEDFEALNNPPNGSCYILSRQPNEKYLLTESPAQLS